MVIVRRQKSNTVADNSSCVHHRRKATDSRGAFLSGFLKSTDTESALLGKSYTVTSGSAFQLVYTIASCWQTEHIVGTMDNYISLPGGGKKTSRTFAYVIRSGVVEKNQQKSAYV